MSKELLWSFPGSLYLYRAKVERLIDADTLVAEIDLGFDIRVKRVVRLYGVDAVEKGTQEGVAAVKYVQSSLPVGSEFLLASVRDRSGSFGRVLGVVYLLNSDSQPEKVSLNLDLVRNGYATWFRVSKIAKETMFERS